MKRKRAFTLVELIVTIALVFILAAVLLPALSGSHRSPYIYCVNNLRQVYLAMSMYQQDNWANNADAPHFPDGAYASQKFLTFAKYLRSPRMLTCPNDNRFSATNFLFFLDANLSYFASSGSYNSTNFLLSGDRTLTTNNKPFSRGPHRINPGGSLSWPQQTHHGKGGLLFADGHVVRGQSNILSKRMGSQPLTNNILVPQKENGSITNWIVVP